MAGRQTSVAEKVASTAAGYRMNTPKGGIEFQQRTSSDELRLIVDRDSGEYHALIRVEENGTLVYQQRGRRRKPGGKRGWIKDTLTNQPMMHIFSLADEAVEMFLEDASARLERKERGNSEGKYRQRVTMALERVCVRESGRTGKPRLRDLRRRLQERLVAQFLRDKEALATLRLFLNEHLDENQWTLNQYNVCVAAGDILRQAHRWNPQTARRYLMETADTTIESAEQCREELQRALAESPPEAYRAPAEERKLRNAAMAIRDANVENHCRHAAQAIWREIEIHWQIRELERRIEGTWKLWTHIVQEALSDHPKEGEPHQTMTPDAEGNGNLTATCDAQAAETLLCGEHLIATVTDQGEWKKTDWATYRRRAQEWHNRVNTPEPQKETIEEKPAGPALKNRYSVLKVQNILGYRVEPIPNPEEEYSQGYLIYDSQGWHIATGTLEWRNGGWTEGKIASETGMAPEPALMSVAQMLAEQCQKAEDEAKGQPHAVWERSETVPQKQRTPVS